MSDVPSIPQISLSKNTFLLNKEKVWGLFGGLLVLAGLGVIGFFLGPYIIALLSMAVTIAGKLLMAVILAAVTGLILAFFAHPGNRANIWYMYTMFARKWTRYMAKRDPIGMMKAFAHEYLEQKLATFREKITIVEAQCIRLKDKVTEFQELLEKALKTAQFQVKRFYDKANEKWLDANAEAICRQASLEHKTRESSIKKFQAQLTMLEKLLAVLRKFEQVFEWKIEQIQLFVEVLSAEYEASKATAEAMREALGALSHGSVKQVFDNVVEWTRSDVAMFMGEAEGALNIFSKVTAEFDVEQSMASDDMMQKLTQMEVSADSLMTNTTEVNQSLRTGDAQKVIELVGSQRPSVAQQIKPLQKWTLRR